MTGGSGSDDFEEATVPCDCDSEVGPGSRLPMAVGGDTDSVGRGRRRGGGYLPVRMGGNGSGGSDHSYCHGACGKAPPRPRTDGS